MLECIYCNVEMLENSGYCWASPDGCHDLDAVDYTRYTDKQLDEAAQALETLMANKDLCYQDFSQLAREKDEIEAEIWNRLTRGNDG